MTPKPTNPNDPLSREIDAALEGMNLQEIDVPGAMPSVIRVLLHYYGPPERRPVHVYLGEAEALREDLTAAQ